MSKPMVKEYSVEELEAMLKIARAKEDIKYRRDYVKNQQSRELTKKRFEANIPKIKAYLLKNLKVGDIITCKGYARHKQVLEVNEDYVLALCGWLRSGEFIRSSYSSETLLEYVSSIRIDGKFVKIKDLI